MQAKRFGDKRKRSKCLAEISLQQQIAEKQWERLIEKTSVPRIVIQNRSRQVQKAVRVLTKFIKEL